MGNAKNLFGLTHISWYIQEEETGELMLDGIPFGDRYGAGMLLIELTAANPSKHYHLIQGGPLYDNYDEEDNN